MYTLLTPRYIPVGTVGGRVVTQAGTLHTGIVGTETNITKLALENSLVQGNRFYTLNVNLYTNISAADNSFLIRVRKDTALSGTVLAAWQWNSVLNADDTKTMSQPWLSGALDTDADFYVSAQRIAGAGDMDIYGDSRAAFWIDDQPVTQWNTVA